MTNNERIGANIRRSLDEKGIKYVFVARNCGVSPAIFARMLAGRREIRLDEMEIIAEAIGCTVEDLFRLPP